MSMTIRQFIEKFDNGDFNRPYVKVQCEAGWYDWFCKDSSLKSKTIKLGKKLKQIANSPKINQDKMYVFFKNNCPLYGNLYDDFRICDIGTGNVIYTVTPSCGHTKKKGKAEVWGRENNFDAPLVEGSWKDVKKFFIE